MNITKAIVGKEPIMEAVDDVTEWVNSVWKKFLGYGTAICSLVMLLDVDCCWHLQWVPSTGDCNLWHPSFRPDDSPGGVYW